MEPRASRTRGFSLIEVVVALAIIAILAGVMAPLALKAVNQAREQRTRGDLKTAYEALFGARDRHVSNMRADYGYAGGSLTQMTTRGGIRAYGPYASQPTLAGGWNGPYWTGMQTPAGLPQDAWGRPLQLRFIGGGYQLLSLGENGVLNSPTQNPQGDDLVYPLPPNPLPVTNLVVNLLKFGGVPPPGTATVYLPSMGNLPGTQTRPSSPPPIGLGPFTFNNLPSGNAVVTVKALGKTQSRAVDLLQGGTVTLDFYF